MAEIRTVTETFAVAGQIRPEELPEFGGRFAAVINNRPDGEDPGQPTAAEVGAAAQAANLAYHHIPISGAPSAEQVRRMQAVVSGVDGPVLAFCRTGTRSIVSWALGQALAGQDVATVTAQGRSAGYDLAPPLEALTAQGRSAGYDLAPPLAALLPRMKGPAGA